MMEKISKTQLDRLGDRLRKGDIHEADLRLLDHYRLSFSEAYEFVVRNITGELGLEPTGRPTKSTTSITEKLSRESIRLTQIQDIAGCRLIVRDTLEQNRIVTSLAAVFPDVTIIDRRNNPSHGYRAVHVVATHMGKLVEVQIRTALQHAWAELSEKLSDVVNAAIKYGGGDETMRNSLLRLSDLVAGVESLEKGVADLLSPGPSIGEMPDALRQQIAEHEEHVRAMNRSLLSDLQAIANQLTNLKRDNDAVSD